MRESAEVISAKQWSMSTESVLPPANWGTWRDAGGLFKFEDGTVWAMMMSRISPVEGYSLSGTLAEYDTMAHYEIFEKRDGVGWEALTGSNFARTLSTPTSGTLLEDLIFKAIDMSATAYRDTLYWHTSPWNQAGTLVEIDKNTRTWKSHSIPKEYTMGSGLSYAIDDDYLWWFANDYDTYSYNYTRLVRMSRVSPYGIEVVDDFTSTLSFIQGGGSYDDVAPNGLIEDLSTSKMFYNDARTLTIHDGYIYMLENRGYETGHSAIKRYNLSTGSIDLLFYATVVAEKNVVTSPGVYDRDTTNGPFPFISGFHPMWLYPPIIKDGWIYYLSQALEQVGSWQSGQAVQRINMNFIIDNMPVKHDEFNPIFETLSNGSTNGETDAKFIYDQRWKSYWRDGNKPLHSMVFGSGWYMEEDGTLVFGHYEAPEYMTAGGSGIPIIISRLSPPARGLMNVSLVFEGTEMKGYAPVHGTPSKACPEIVDLV